MRFDPFKHHRRSIRLRGYDYSKAGAYFVTICTQNRECLLGEIANAGMHLNPFGEIILKWWDELPNYYPPVELDEFAVMPNHLHGLFVITDVGAESSRAEKRTLGQLIGYFKFQVTKEINQVRGTAYVKVLQRDYYEHIIRNERERNAIAEYIYNNPANWIADLDNPANFTKRPVPNSADDYWRDVGL